MSDVQLQGMARAEAITKGLIEKNILVLSGGCTSSVMEYTGLTDPKAADEAGEGLKAVCKQLGIPPVLTYGACVDIGKMTHTAMELADALNYQDTYTRKDGFHTNNNCCMGWRRFLELLRYIFNMKSLKNFVPILASSN